jgi:hypothetical protein
MIIFRIIIQMIIIIIIIQMIIIIIMIRDIVILGITVVPQAVEVEEVVYNSYFQLLRLKLFNHIKGCGGGGCGGGGGGGGDS